MRQYDPRLGKNPSCAHAKTCHCGGSVHGAETQHVQAYSLQPPHFSLHPPRGQMQQDGADLRL